jgi:LmbE family N-acetylglucosaminyl deacetylase
MSGQEVHLFISPHLDDAVLSCGGTIRQLASSGKQVVVATLITADSPVHSPLTWLARRNHHQWGAEDMPFSLRCKEDANAIASLGAEHVHLGLLDAIYRRTQDGEPLYTKDIVNVPVHEEDRHCFEPLVNEKLVALLQSFNSQTVRIYCPLALATHVDHIIIRHAVEKVATIKHITYYEEFPYTVRPHVFDDWRNSPDGSQEWTSKVVELSEEEIKARITAISCYKTQVPFLFPSTLLSLHEIALARLPVIEKIFPLKPDREAAIQRMETVTRSYVSVVHGERYWFKSVS